MARMKTGITKNCLYCGNPFYVRPSRIEKQICCSKRCASMLFNPMRGIKIEGADRNKVKLCAGCGAEFKNVTPSVKYCSHKCFTETIKGIAKVSLEHKTLLRKKRNARHNHIKRARRRKCESEKFDAVDIFHRDNWKCHLCGSAINQKLKWPHPKSASIDHIVPLSKGGGHLRVNVKACHLRCNIKKNNKSLQEQLVMFG